MKLKAYFILPFLLQATLWRITMRPFFSLLARFEVHGLENLKNVSGPVIFAPNHTSELDSILLPLALPLWSRFMPMFYIIREPSFYTDKAFSWRRHFYDLLPFNALGAYSIISGIKDYERSLATHVQILRDGRSLSIFPEGAFTKNGELGPARGGLGYLAHTTSATVIPVYIAGTYRFSFLKAFLGRERISISFLSPVHSKIMATNQVEFIEQCRDFGEIVIAAIRERKNQQAIAGFIDNQTVPVLKKNA